MRRAALSFFFLITLAQSTLAQEVFDGAFLDSPYNDLETPIVDILVGDKDDEEGTSDIVEMMKIMSPVKSQGSRGTCSIFSATALMESHMLKVGYREDIDLSEEWLEYTVISDLMADEDGSTSSWNFKAMYDYGVVEEETLPYIGQTWKSLDDGLATERCGDLDQRNQKVCLVSHWDPQFLNQSIDEIAEKSIEFSLVKESAEAWKEEDVRVLMKRPSQWWSNSSTSWQSNYKVRRISEVKYLLRNNVPLTMGFDFYYGAWNHSKAPKLGITRNFDLWNKGIVTYPERGSIDRKRSKEKPAGHSVLVVGYDDNRVIEAEIEMEDGTKQTFTYKGVYYFKNSWGTTSFGKDFEINGVNYPGYGMMPYKHAHDFGGFHKLPLR